MGASSRVSSRRQASCPARCPPRKRARTGSDRISSSPSSVSVFARYGAGDPRPKVVEADSFYGLRDAIHRIAPSVTAIARPGTTVAFFDAERLQKLCERSPEQVVAVLERLG